MGDSSSNFQQIMLNGLRKNRISVTVFMTNGFQIRGIITAFDHYVVFIETDGKQQMLYKHAISTIAPTRNVPLFTVSKNNDGSYEED